MDVSVMNMTDLDLLRVALDSPSLDSGQRGWLQRLQTTCSSPEAVPLGEDMRAALVGIADRREGRDEDDRHSSVGFGYGVVPPSTKCKCKRGSCFRCGTTDRRDVIHTTRGGAGVVGALRKGAR